MTDFFLPFVAAYVRGRWHENHAFSLPESLLLPPLSELSTDQLTEIIQIGESAGLRLHRFKRTMGLARVSKVLGYLQALRPSELLDVGSGRGAFLWPLLDTFPQLPVTTVERNPERAEQLRMVQSGGVERLDVHCLDVTDPLPFADLQFDVVTVLEVLEHIPQVERAVRELVRVARRFVLVSVPSKPDDNLEHIHLFTQAQLRSLFMSAGAATIKFDTVHNHLLAIVKVK